MPGSFDTIKPAGFAWAVTPSDSTPLAMTTRAIYVGVGGDVSVSMVDPATNKQANVTFVGVPSGTILPIETPLVRSTSTTASNIVGLA